MLKTQGRYTHYPVPPMPYDDGPQRQAYLAIFGQLLAAGWDLPAKHAQALVDMPDENSRSLEQQHLVVRYLRAMGYAG